MSAATLTVARSCCVCGASLAGHYSNAVTCSRACRQKLYRQREKERGAPKPTPQLLKRYEAALGIVPQLEHPNDRLDLLAAVIWPRDERLRDAA